MPRSAAVRAFRSVAGEAEPVRARFAALSRVFSVFWPTLAVVSGWSLITAGIAELTSPLAWLFSAGLLLVSLVGWKPLFTVAVEGLPGIMAKWGTDA